MACLLDAYSFVIAVNLEDSISIPYPGARHRYPSKWINQNKQSKDKYYLIKFSCLGKNGITSVFWHSGRSRHNDWHPCLFTIRQKLPINKTHFRTEWYRKWSTILLHHLEVWKETRLCKKWKNDLSLERFMYILWTFDDLWWFSYSVVSLEISSSGSLFSYLIWDLCNLPYATICPGQRLHFSLIARSLWYAYLLKLPFFLINAFPPTF